MDIECPADEHLMFGATAMTMMMKRCCGMKILHIKNKEMKMIKNLMGELKMKERRAKRMMCPMSF